MSSKHYIYSLIASGLFHLGEALGDENRTSTLIEVSNGEAGATDYSLLALYIIGVVYTFLGLAIVCDEYFVPSLEIMSDKWNLAPNVAGATLMAAGGSAPELFTSFIGTFQGSSVGFSTIVGSAVFNVLFVIGACVLCQRETLHLTPWPLIRDCSYYTISLVVLSLFFSVITPNVIEVWEAAILFTMYLFYVYLMKNNDRLQQYFMGNSPTPNTSNTPEPVTFRAGLVRLMLEPVNFMEGVSILVVTKISGDIQETFQTIDKDGNGYLDREEVTTLLTSLGYQRNTTQLDEFFTLLDKNGDGQISQEEFSEWYLGSETRLEDDANRIYQEVAVLSEGDNINKNDINLLLRRLGNESSDEPKEAIEKDIQLDNIGVDLESGELTYPQFLEWYKKSLLWKEKQDLQERQLEEAEGIDLSFPSTPFERMKWIATIPMLLAFYLTIPDVRKPQLAKWKYLTFLISIVWIGFISYWMVNWAETIGHTLGIPINVMGLTILAAGTSVPDLLSSMIVARQGEGDMAISSSIGSNIFDILVGLPLPWLVYGIYHDSSVTVEAGNLTISLPILIAMLVIVMGSIHLCEWQTKRPLAYLMFLSYIVFVAQDLARSDW